MNKKLLPFLLLAVIFTASFFACKKADDDAVVTDGTSQYIPLQVGKYIIYNVDSTIWVDTQCVVLKKHFQIMYTVADTFTDDQGRYSYRIDTRIRKKTDEAWQLQEELYVSKTDVNFEWSQSGVKMVKMIFPVKNGATWKGNSYIPAADADLKYFDGWDYKYSNEGEAFNTGEVIYPKTVTVNQVDRVENDPETIPNLAGSRTYGKEVYAEGIGMVYREYIRWTYDPGASFNNDPYQPNRCRKGWGVVMKAVDHN